MKPVGQGSSDTSKDATLCTSPIHAGWYIQPSPDASSEFVAFAVPGCQPTNQIEKWLEFNSFPSSFNNYKVVTVLLKIIVQNAAG